MKLSISLNDQTYMLACAVMEAEKSKSMSAFIAECIIRHSANLGYILQPASVVKVSANP